MSSVLPSPSRLVAVALACCLVVAAAACGGDGGGLGSPSRKPQTLRVPQDVRTIEGAVKVAVPGDLILVSPGTYRESVTVDVPRVVIRGLSRSKVVVDGAKKLDDGFRVTADGVAIENLTVKDFNVNGIIFTGTRPEGASASTPLRTLVGYRASYITAVGNGLYGVYAFASRTGLFDQIYASGSPDAGIYVGQCKPCDAVVRHSTAEFNAIGYEGTNAGGNLFVVGNVFRHNQVGLTSNSEDKEKLAPQAAATFAGNLVVDNGDPAAPQLTEGGYGVGMVVGGGTRNEITHNRVSGNPVGGIVVTDLDQFTPKGNKVEANTLEGNGIDLVYGWQGAATVAAGNCFARNVFTTSKPSGIEEVLACGTAGSAAKLDQIEFPAPPGGGTVRVPAPPADLPELPSAATAPAEPASGPAPKVATADLQTPAKP